MVKTKYDKEGWDYVDTPTLRRYLKNYEKVNKLLFNTAGYTTDEYKAIMKKIKKGEDLVKLVLKDRLEGRCD